MGEKTAPEKGHGDFFVRFTAAQVLCCVLLLALVFGLYKLNGPAFQRLRQEYARLTETDLDPGSFRFFDFGSAFEKQDGGTASAAPAGADGTRAEDGPWDAADAPTAETGTADAAGGADLPADRAQRELSFAFYDAGAAVVVPVNGTCTSPFGERVHPIYGTTGFHSGKDIAAPEGTPVHAAKDGVVLTVGAGETSGNYVRLSHGDGMETLYCHLCAANVAEGVAVRCGDVIGFVGQTGLATGPHLHFEVQIDGVKYDPDHLLAGASVVS